MMVKRKTIILNNTSYAGSTETKEFDTAVFEGWEPDPVWMPTNRPNIADNFLVYHLIWYTEEEKKAIADAKFAPNPIQMEEVLFTVAVANNPDSQKEWFDKGYRIIPDKIYQKEVIMKLVKPVGQPASSPNPLADNPGNAATAHNPEDK